MMYYVPFIILVILAIIEYTCKWKYAYYIGIVMLTLMLCLRFGQGTDYLAYFLAYHLGDFHSEIGYRLFCELLYSLKLPYEFLCGFIGVATMYCLDKAIRRYSPWRAFSLLLIYPTIFLTYFFSAVRQGFVIAFFLGFMLSWIEEGKIIRYIAACVLLMTIHISAIVFIPILLLKKVPMKRISFLVICAAVCGIVFTILPKSFFQIQGLRRFSYYLSDCNVSVLGLIERVSMFLIINILYWKGLSDERNAFSQYLLKIYYYGFAITLVFMPWSLMASRIPAALKAIEVLFIPILILDNKKSIQRFFAMFFLIYTFVMVTKNLHSYIQQGSPCYDGYNPLTYPYINIVNKEEYENIWKTNKYYQEYVWYVLNKNNK